MAEEEKPEVAHVDYEETESGTQRATVTYKDGETKQGESTGGLFTEPSKKEAVDNATNS